VFPAKRHSIYAVDGEKWFGSVWILKYLVLKPVLGMLGEVVFRKMAPSEQV